MDRNACHQPVAMRSPMADGLFSYGEAGSIQMYEAALQRINGGLGPIARAHFIQQ